MRIRLAIAGALACMAFGGVVVLAASGTPEVDRANATLQLSGKLRPVSCVGEDGITYVTYHGSYGGGESQVAPDPTDYNLSGTVKVVGIAWTINKSTGRGVLTGSITLTNPASGLGTYKGPLTLVTQGLPAAGATVPGRGWIKAAIVASDDNQSPAAAEDTLLANVEFNLSPTSANGQFGDGAGNGTLGFPDWSAVTNVPADGVC